MADGALPTEECIWPEAIDGAFRPAVRPTVASEELDGEIVLYDEQRNVVHRLNRTASAVFALIDGDPSVDEIVAMLAGAYSVPADRIANDVLAVVRQFGARHLLAGVRGRDDDAAEPATQSDGR